MKIFFSVSLFLFILGAAEPSGAQDKVYARHIIDTLSSPFFAGRGYVDNGDLKAAKFIAEKFHEIGLKSFGNAGDYMQRFTFPVNIFPGKMMVRMNDEELIPGKDYIVDPVSGGCKKQKMVVLFIDSARVAGIIKGNPGKFPRKRFALVLDKKLFESTLKNTGIDIFASLKPSAIITINDGRLVWSVSSVHIDIPLIETKIQAIKDASTVTIQIDEVLQDHHTQNITGYIKGSVYPDSFIFLTAHYDHLGEMGKSTYFPGANDNASGTALLIDLARYFSGSALKPAYSVGFIAFAGEEAGLVGSKYYTTYPIVPLNKIAFLINMDLMANGQDGMMVVNGSVFVKEYNRLLHINDSARYLSAIDKRGKAANSDHYWFTEKGVKSFFFYLLGKYPYYHDVFDTPDKPSYAGYNGAFRLIRDFIVSFHSDN